MNMRRLVFDVLLYSEQQHIFVNSFLKENIEFEKLSVSDQKLAYKIIYGVLQNKLLLDYQLNQFLSKPRKLNKKVRIILQMAAYQSIFLDRIPDHAICSESVNLAKILKLGKLSGLVNAVSRKLLEIDKSNLLLPSKSDMSEYLSVKYSHPKWLVKRWIGQRGVENTESILAANNSTQGTTIRINPSKISLDEVKYELDKLNIKYSEVKLTKDLALEVEAGDIFKTAIFKDGMISIQDQGSIKACLELELDEGVKILDMCSAPGGKTALIGNLTNNNSEIIAVDVNPNRLKEVSETCYRMGAKNVKAVVKDAREIKQSDYGKFDRILLDAPCTGLGTIRTKPEIRWYREEKDIYRASKLQLELFKNGLSLLKENGILVYVTCSNEYEETEGIIDQVKDIRVMNMTQLYPNCYDSEGFFIAKIKHKEGV
jgi:16S rRNA (cytosine967-C5)-methyltransferase